MVVKLSKTFLLAGVVSTSFALSGCDPSVVEGFLSANKAPIVQDDLAAVEPDHVLERVNVLENDLDVDGDELYIVGAHSTVGRVTIEDNTLSFTPPAGFAGLVRIMYTVSDGEKEGAAFLIVTVGSPAEMVGGLDQSSSASSAAPVVVTSSSVASSLAVTDSTPVASSSSAAPIAVINLAPVAVNDETTTFAGTVLAGFNVLTNDRDPEGDSLELLNAVTESGSISYLSNGSLTFTPSSDYVGPVNITYTISDGVSTSVGNLLVQVSALPGLEEAPVVSNTAPRVRNDVAQLEYDTPLLAYAILANDEDAEGDVLTVVDAYANVGEVSIRSDGTVDYSPRLGYQGIAVVYYTVSDGQAQSEAKLVVQMVPPLESEPDQVASASSSSSAPSQVVAPDAFSVVVSWQAPDAREGGELLDTNEIEAYELAFKATTDNDFETILVEGGTGVVPEFEFANLPAGEYALKIATIDEFGLKSNYSSEMHVAVGL